MPQSLRPELTVAAVVAQHDRFLIIEEMVHDRAVFNQPAGHVEPGESLIEAVVRETREESAWDFVPDAITGIYLYTDKATARTYLRVVFTGHLLSHHADQALDDGVLRTLWLGRSDLLARRARLRSPLVLRSIDDFLAGHRLPVDMASQDDLAERAARL